MENEFVTLADMEDCLVTLADGSVWPKLDSDLARISLYGDDQEFLNRRYALTAAVLVYQQLVQMPPSKRDFICSELQRIKREGEKKDV